MRPRSDSRSGLGGGVGHRAPHSRRGRTCSSGTSPSRTWSDRTGTSTPSTRSASRPSGCSSPSSTPIRAGTGSRATRAASTPEPGRGPQAGRGGSAGRRPGGGSPGDVRHVAQRGARRGVRAVPRAPPAPRPAARRAASPSRGEHRRSASALEPARSRLFSSRFYGGGGVPCSPR